MRKRFDPDEQLGGPLQTCSSPLSAIPRPIGSAVLLTSTFSTPRHCRPRQREALLMRIGVLCRSEYEWAAHSRLGREGRHDRCRRGPHRRRSGKRRWRSSRDGVVACHGRALQKMTAYPMTPGRRLRKGWTRVSCSTCSSPSAATGRHRWRSTPRAFSSTPTWRTSDFRRRCARLVRLKGRLMSWAFDGSYVSAPLPRCPRPRRPVPARRSRRSSCWATA